MPLTVLKVNVPETPAAVPVHVEPEQVRLAKVTEPSFITTELDITVLPPVPTTPPRLGGVVVIGNAALAAAKPGEARPATSRATRITGRIRAHLLLSTSR